MDYTEFTLNFQTVHICHQIDSEDTTDSPGSTWTKQSVDVELVAGESEGDDESQGMQMHSCNLLIYHKINTILLNNHQWLHYHTQYLMQPLHVWK